MQSSNGIDLAAIYQLLQDVAGRLGVIETRIASHSETLDGLVAVANQHSRKMDDLAAALAELRLNVNQYHGAVVGPGIELTRLDERVKRIEAHLKLDSTAV